MCKQTWNLNLGSQHNRYKPQFEIKLALVIKVRLVYEPCRKNDIYSNFSYLCDISSMVPLLSFQNKLNRLWTTARRPHPSYQKMSKALRIDWNILKQYYNYSNRSSWQCRERNIINFWDTPLKQPHQNTDLTRLLIDRVYSFLPFKGAKHQLWKQ